VREAVVGQVGQLDVVVNNAGYELAGALEELSVEEAKAQFETSGRWQRNGSGSMTRGGNARSRLFAVIEVHLSFAVAPPRGSVRAGNQK
jgi:NAD(P)-dependent dehydrogenase (short-subunit alcohol dehydrogenase family)